MSLSQIPPLRPLRPQLDMCIKNVAYVIRYSALVLHSEKYFNRES